MCNANKSEINDYLPKTPQENGDCFYHLEQQTLLLCLIAQKEHDDALVNFNSIQSFRTCRKGKYRTRQKSNEKQDKRHSGFMKDNGFI